MFFVYKTARDYLKTSWLFVAFALAAGFFTLAPHLWGILDSVDYQLARAINSAIGQSGAYDAFLKFMNRDETQILGAAVIFVIYLVFAWRERFWDMGRLLGYLLWMGAGVVLALMLAYYLTERIEVNLRVQGPNYQLEEFRNINSFHEGWDVDVKDERSVPSTYAVVYFSVFWLAFFRARGLSLALLIPAIFFTPAYMLVGREWPSSVVAGILWGGAIGALLTRTPLALVPERLEEASVIWVERLLTFWAPSLPKKASIEKPITRTVDMPGGPQIVLRDTPPVRRDHLARVIERHILPLLNCAPDSTVTISGLPPAPMAGQEPSRWMRFVTGGGLKSGIVVKAAWKNPLNATQGRRFLQRRNAASVHALLQLHDMPVPRLSFTQNTRRIFAPRRFFFTVEDLIETRALKPGHAPDAAAAAAVLARMHTIERVEAGGLFGLQMPRERYPHRVILPRVRHAYATIIQELPGAELSFFGQHTLNWFWERAADQVETGRLFHLCHGNLKPEFVRMCESGPVLMGFTKSQFDLPGFDLLQALVLWSDGNLEAMAALAESYFAAAPNGMFALFQKGFELFLAMTLFEMLHEHLHLPVEAREEKWTLRMANQAAEALRGHIESPGAPADLARIVHQVVFVSE